MPARLWQPLALQQRIAWRNGQKCIYVKITNDNLQGDNMPNPLPFSRPSRNLEAFIQAVLANAPQGYEPAQRPAQPAPEPQPARNKIWVGGKLKYHP